METTELEKITNSYVLLNRDLANEYSDLNPSEFSLYEKYAFYHRQALAAITLCTNYQQFIRARTIIALGLTALENSSYSTAEIPTVFLEPSESHDHFFQESLTELNSNAQHILETFSRYDLIIRIKFATPVESRFDKADLRTIYRITGSLISKAEIRQSRIGLYDLLEIETQRTLALEWTLSIMEINILYSSFALTLIALEQGYDKLYTFEQMLEKDSELFYQNVRTSLSRAALSVLSDLSTAFVNRILLERLKDQELSDEVNFQRISDLFILIKRRLDTLQDLNDKYKYLNSIGYALRAINGHNEGLNHEKIVFVLSLLYIEYGDNELDTFLQYLSSPTEFIQKVKPHLNARSEILLREYELNAFATAFSNFPIPRPF